MRLTKAPDHEGGESQDGREPHLGESEGDQSESMERKARRASLEQVEGSMSR